MRDLSRVIAELKKQREAAKADLDRIDQAIAALGDTVKRPEKRAEQPKIPAPARRRRRRRMSDAARKAASERMKKYWAEHRSAAPVG